MKSNYKGKIEVYGQWIEIWETSEDNKIGIDIVDNTTDVLLFGICPDYGNFIEALTVALNEFSEQVKRYKYIDNFIDMKSTQSMERLLSEK